MEQPLLQSNTNKSPDILILFTLNKATVIWFLVEDQQITADKQSVIGIGKPWYGPFSIFTNKIEISIGHSL